MIKSYDLANARGKLVSEEDAIFCLDVIKDPKSANKLKYHAAKLLGTLGKDNAQYINEYSTLISRIDYSLVRRELTSCIGRARTEKSIDLLLQLLTDKDPKVVMQAMRGLLVFKDVSKVQKGLLQLKNHENEMIKEIIQSEVISDNKKGKAAELSEIKVHEFLNNKVIKGDARTILNEVPKNSIDLTFTSPPYYNARDYSFYDSYSSYLKFLETTFKRLHEATKEGRFFVLNTSPVIVPRFSRSHSSKRYAIPFDIHAILTKIGWEFIDDIIWLKPEASVKNRNGGFFQHRTPLTYKPNSITEYLMVYRKKTTKLIDWNLKQYSADIKNKSKVSGSYDSSNVWSVDPKFDKLHSAVFPEKLVEKVVQYYSFEGDLICDPFAGSGTVGLQARTMNRNFLLIEIDETYIDRIKERVGIKDTESILTPLSFKKGLHDAQATRN